MPDEKKNATAEFYAVAADGAEWPTWFTSKDDAKARVAELVSQGVKKVRLLGTHVLGTAAIAEVTGDGELADTTTAVAKAAAAAPLTPPAQAAAATAGKPAGSAA